MEEMGCQYFHFKGHTGSHRLMKTYFAIKKSEILEGHRENSKRLQREKAYHTQKKEK